MTWSSFLQKCGHWKGSGKLGEKNPKYPPAFQKEKASCTLASIGFVC